MAVTQIRKISSWIFIVAITISLLVFGIYYGGGYVDPTAEVPEPVYTNILLYWLYILLAVVLGMSVFFAVVQIGKLLKEDPKSGFLSLGAFLLLVALLFVTYTVGDGTPLPLLGYEGTENVPFWLKTADMWLFSIYVLLVLIVGVISWGSIKRLMAK